eukprot:4770755-Lingulodinium_polyedra.AAC.1
MRTRWWRQQSRFSASWGGIIFVVVCVVIAFAFCVRYWAGRPRRPRGPLPRNSRTRRGRAKTGL